MTKKGEPIMLQTVLIVLLVLLLLGGIGTLPTWSHSRNWGYGASGGISLLGLVVLVLLILLLTGRL
jgi:membrane protein YdbS with pleckstrin-like domain